VLHRPGSAPGRVPDGARRHARAGFYAVSRPGARSAADASPRPLRDACCDTARRLEATVTFIWFVIWLIANNVGDTEPLIFDPVNAWVATLILAIALDLGASHAHGRGSAKSA
jgi:hypothetical protein